MNSPQFLPTALAVMACTATASASLISDLGKNYNSTILGNLFVDSADTEGRQLVTGNFTSDIPFHYSVGASVIGSQNPPEAGRDDLIIGGNYTRQGEGGVIVTENAVIGGSIPADHRINFNSAGPTSSGQGTLNHGVGEIKISSSTGNVSTEPSAFSINLLQAAIAAESTSLSQIATSPGVTSISAAPVSLDINTNSSADDVYIINVSGDDWASSSYVSRNITASAGSTLIINVDGASLNIGGTINLNGGITENRVLVNYFEAETLSFFRMSHNGSILAPTTDEVTISGGAINGVSFLAGDVVKEAGGEFHNYLFEGTLPGVGLQVVAVPEPSSSALISMGALGLLLRRKRS